MTLVIEFRYADGRTMTDRVQTAGPVPPDVDTPMNPQIYLQLFKVVHDEMAAPIGIGFFVGDALVTFNYGPKGRVVVRRPRPDEEAHSYRDLRAVVLPFQMRVPAGLFRRAQVDAVMLLRLGAASNALQMILNYHGMLGSAENIIRDRDLVHLTIIIASYIREVDHIINGDKSQVGRIWALAERGVKLGRRLPHQSLDECRQLLDPAGDLLKRIKEIRNLVGFHLLPQEFKTWLASKSPDEMLTLEFVPDPTRSDIVFVASTEAVADACNQPEDSRFFAEATTLAVDLPYLLEASLTGLLAEQGFDVGRFLAFDPRAVFTGPSKWAEPDSPAGGSGTPAQS